MLDADVWIETGCQARLRGEAEDLAAEAWGARRAWLLTNGSTAGNLAWFLGTTTDDEPVVIGRDAHLSVLTGLVLSGARPIWVPPRIHPRHEIPLGVDAEDVASALARHPGARQVVVTSPGYAATCADLSALVAVTRRAGAGLYVDQAWGAHLAFHPGVPIDGIRAGALGAVVSIHKTGTAMSSGSVLLAGTGLDDARVACLDRAVRMTQTTSPLMPLLASIDAARRDLAVEGVDGLDRALADVARLGEQLREIEGVRMLRPDDVGLPPDRMDPLKSVIDVSGLGTTGWDVERDLRGLGVAVEGADDRRIYRVHGACAEGRRGDQGGRGSVEALVTALTRVAHARSLGGDRPETGGAAACRPWPSARVPGQRRGPAGAWRATTALPEQALTPRQALRAACVVVPVARAVGRVAAEPVVPYPPGVPLLMPGEVVDSEVLETLHAVVRHGGHLHGCHDPGLGSLRVVDL